MFSGRVFKNEAEKDLANEIELTLTGYTKLPWQNAYDTLEKTATKVDKSIHWSSFKNELGQLYYTMAMLLYKHSDDVVTNFQKIKICFSQAHMLDYADAKEPERLMSQCRDPFTGERITEVPLLDSRGPVKPNNEQPLFFEENNLQIEQTKAMFENLDSLETAIKNSIFPCVISIRTSQGIGTGFFKFEKWLVSNAHVLPNNTCVKEAIFTDNQFNASKIDLGEYGSFHRKVIEGAPDISIINVSNPVHSLPFHEFSSDLFYKDGACHYFYVYLDHETQERKIGYIEQHKFGELCSTFTSKSHVVPEPGSSGSPVFKARLSITGHQPQWKFTNIGAIFARSLQEGNFLIHVISDKLDFEQIRTDIIIPYDESKRLRQEAIASNNNEKLSEQRSLDAKKHEQLTSNGFMRYTEETNLITNLPPGLEKLIYSDAELLAMNKRQAQQLDRSDRESLERLCRSEEKAKEKVIKRLQESSKTSTGRPFTPQFDAAHVSKEGMESLNATQDRVTKTRSYADESGEKKSTVMQMSEDAGKQEIQKIANSLTTGDLIKTESGGYQIKKGVIHTTDQDYPMSSASLKFGSKGKRKINKDFSKTKQKAEVGVKIDEDGELKLSHFEKPKSPTPF